jgi:hypothetical protein
LKTSKKKKFSKTLDKGGLVLQHNELRHAGVQREETFLLKDLPKR